MQTRPASAAYRLRAYRSKHSNATGLEVLILHGGPEHASRAIREVEALDTVNPTGFVIMQLPRPASERDVEDIARAATESNIQDKMAVVCDVDSVELPAVIAALHNLGIKALLGNVGAQARFAVLTEYAIDGVVVETGLVARASGDPQAASVLESITSLSANLGLKTFASCRDTPLDAEVAISCGIDYVSFEIPETRRAFQSQTPNVRALSSAQTITPASR